MGDAEAARQLFQRAMEIWDGQNAPHPVYTVGVMTNLAALHMQDSTIDEALLLYKSAVKIQENAFGKDSARLANLLRELRVDTSPGGQNRRSKED